MSILTQTRSELTKVTTTAGWWVLALVLVLYVGLAATGLGWVLARSASGDLGGPSVPANLLPPTLYGLAASFGYIFPLLIGTLIVTAEFRTHTLVPTFLAAPRRGGVLFAKVVAGVVFGALLAVIALVAAVGPGAALLSAHGLDAALTQASTWALVGRSVLALVLWAIIGVGLGALVRNQVAGIVIALAFPLFIEPLVRIAGGFVTWVADAAHYLPGAASEALVASGATLFGGGSSDGLVWWGGALVLAGYAVVLPLAALAFSWRRDVA